VESFRLVHNNDHATVGGHGLPGWCDRDLAKLSQIVVFSLVSEFAEGPVPGTEDRSLRAVDDVWRHTGTPTAKCRQLT
jgi:hypothetical protein